MLPFERSLLSRACLDLTFWFNHGFFNSKEYKILIFKLYSFFLHIDRPELSNEQIITKSSIDLCISKGTAINYKYRDYGVKLPEIFGVTLLKKKDYIKVSYYSRYYIKKMNNIINFPEISNFLESGKETKLINNQILNNTVLVDEVKQKFFKLLY